VRNVKKVLILIGFIVLGLAAWLVSVNRKSDATLQLENLTQAKAYLEDKIYVRAVPLLESAASYKGEYSAEAEDLLRDAYTHLFNDTSYVRKYETLLESEMGREDCPPKVYLEAAKYYREKSQTEKVFSYLHEGMKTGDQELIDYYESIRYEYSSSFGKTFRDVTMLYEDTIQIQDRQTGKWGLANRKGKVVIPCEYDKISTYDGYCVVRKDNEVFLVNIYNFRMALCHDECLDFGNLAASRMGIRTRDGWKVSTPSFKTGSVIYQQLGMFSDECAPARSDGKWGLIEMNGAEWRIPATYDGIIQDELGRAYAQNAVFFKKNSKVILNVNGVELEGSYEDARPFTEAGWAAVKKNGKWGFVDTEGVIQIDCRYEDARSFSFGLAAVQVDEKWGFIDPNGKLVIAAEYVNAKDFCNGSAPVETEDGWKLLTLKEFE